jgi:hypothetical protein
MEYRVRYEIDVTADTPEEAAEEAFAAMVDPSALLPCLEVQSADGAVVTIDLDARNR